MIMLQNPVLNIENSMAEYKNSKEKTKQKLDYKQQKLALIAYQKGIIKDSDFNAHKRKQLGRRYN